MRRDDHPPASAEALRKQIVARHSVRLHCALILFACFGVGLLVTKLLLSAGVDAMWVRYALALLAAYLTFLLGVRIWLHYAGFHRWSTRDGLGDAIDAADLPVPRGAGSGRVEPIFSGGGGRSGGGGSSAHFGVDADPSPKVFALSSGGNSGGGIDLDDGWVLVLLIAAVLAIAGSALWLIYAAPAILADAAFAALLSAGLVRSTRRMTGDGWIGSVVGNTWIAFTVVLVVALAFALVAQHHFPDARTLADVWRRI